MEGQGPTSSIQSLYLRLGELSGKIDTVLQQTSAAAIDAQLARAVALKLETRLDENKTVEKANQAAIELGNIKFLQRALVAPAALIGFVLSALLATHLIWGWPA